MQQMSSPSWQGVQQVSVVPIAPPKFAIVWQIEHVSE